MLSSACTWPILSGLVSQQLPAEREYTACLLRVVLEFANLHRRAVQPRLTTDDIFHANGFLAYMWVHLFFPLEGQDVSLDLQRDMHGCLPRRNLAAVDLCSLKEGVYGFSKSLQEQRMLNTKMDLCR